MKQFDIYLAVPELKDPDDQKEMSSFVAKLQDILQQISNNLGVIDVVSSAPVATELQERGDGRGNILSEVKILDNATQTSRRIYYKFQGNLRLIESD